jgi:hypothetical protein
VHVAVPHSGHEDFDVGGFEVAEGGGEVFDEADMFDFLAGDDDSGVFDGRPSSWD